jgi:hypothetical protein
MQTNEKELQDPSGNNGNLVNKKLECWKTTIGVVNQFNDLELRIRNYGLTIVGVLLGVTPFTLKDMVFIHIGRLEVSISVLLIIAAIIVWLAFYFMDRLWYHDLLKGAVDHGEKIEKSLKAELTEIVMLTTRISEASEKRKLFGLQLTSPRKMDMFYGIFALCLILIAIVLCFSIRPETNTGELILK